MQRGSNLFSYSGLLYKIDSKILSKYFLGVAELEN